MLKIGVTGGIGSGKTYVCQLLETAGIPVFYSDEEGRRLTKESPTIKEKLVNFLGEECYKDDTFDAKYVAAKVFNDAQLLQQVNAIIHPEVIKKFEEFTNQYSDEEVVAMESAIIFECGLDKVLDKIVLVTAPLETRIRRVMERDNLTFAEVEARIKNQMKDDRKVGRTDFIIKNDGVDTVATQLFELLKVIDY